jgi:hypothetical protein
MFVITFVLVRCCLACSPIFVVMLCMEGFAFAVFAHWICAVVVLLFFLLPLMMIGITVQFFC